MAPAALRRIATMAEKLENEAAEPTQAPVQQQQQPQQPQQMQVDVDDTHVIAAYANFCRVTGSPEELVVDFGLNMQPIGVTEEPVAVTQRVIVNYFTAKRLLQILAATVARHEAVFGALETDVLKRVVK